MATTSNRLRGLAGGLLAVGFTALLGCSGEPTNGEVSGTVTVDGAPPMDGSSITFVPANGGTAGFTFEGNTGKYVVQVPVGSSKVQIYAVRKKDTKGKAKAAEGPGPSGGSDIEMILGPEYNDQTTLTLDVKPGKNEKNWDLKSKK